jgi:hypothetical protein
MKMSAALSRISPLVCIYYCSLIGMKQPAASALEEEEEKSRSENEWIIVQEQ